MAEFSAQGGSWITRALGDEGRVRIIVVEADEVANDLRDAHDLTATQARLAAEGTVASLLLAAYAKGEEKLSLQAGLTDPPVRFIGELDPSHGFRGRLAGPPLGEDADLARLDGLLMVAKYEGDRELYRGITAIDHTSITGALHSHLSDSSQVHGALCTRVEVSQDGQVQTAIGVLVERLPPEAGQPHHEAEAFHERWADLSQDDAIEVLKAFDSRVVRGEAVHILDVRPVFWGCSCNRGRLLGALAGLGSATLIEMADQDHGANVRCEYCATDYAITEAELRELASA